MQDPFASTTHDAEAERWTRTSRAGILLVLLLLAVYVPGQFSIPVVDRDEARFAQASRQMFEALAWPDHATDTRPITTDDAGRLTGGPHAGGWAVPMVGERPRLAKPPLIYWVQTACAATLTRFDPLADRIWHYRVPSVLSAIAACLITWRLGIAMGHARAGWLGAALLGISPMVVWDAHQARADQLLLFTTTGAMAALMMIRGVGLGESRGGEDEPRSGRAGWLWPIAFWCAIGAGILTKGPITPMIAALSAIAFSWVVRDWRWLRRTRPLLGVPILVVILTPWVVATARTVGWDTLVNIWFAETIGRSAEPSEGHWGPPGYHLVLLAVLFWPGSLLTLHALRAAWHRAVQLHTASPVPGRLARWKQRTTPDNPTLFLLAWIIPSWLVFELVGTKLPHYTLPLYPPLALLSARAVFDLADQVAAPAKPVPPRAGLVIWMVIGLLLTGLAPIAIARLDGSPGLVAAAALGAVLSVGLIFVAASRVRTSILRTHALAIAATVVFAVTLLGVVLPRARPLQVTQQLAALIRTAPSDAPVAAAGYHEDSLTFATRARLVRLSPDRVPAWAAANPGGVLILPLGAPGQPGWTQLGRVSGINYSKGDRVELVVFRIDPIPASWYRDSAPDTAMTAPRP
jgi:4-amino-4-deoxy-L-arabinose transferase-like glycosyltransferase